jgi:hypothetical protein
MYENNYRVRFPKKNVYISRNHQWALAAWAMGLRSGVIGPRTTLLHVDGHLDDTWDGVIAPGLQEMETTEEIMAVAGRLEIDNFIWAGFAAKLVDHIVYVCPKDVDPSDPFDLSEWDLDGEQLQPIKQLLAERPYKGFRYESIDEFRRRMENRSAREEILDSPSSVILDLDLDVFKLNIANLTDRELLPEYRIKEHLAFLRDLYPYDLVTVALSPAFCGGDENCERLYKLFLEVFDLDLSEAEVW